MLPLDVVEALGDTPFRSTAINCIPPSLRAEFETTPVTQYSRLASSFLSPQWVGRTTGTIWKIATLIVLIKRAVTPISEQPDAKDLHLALLSLSISVHGSSWDERQVVGEFERLHRLSSSCSAPGK